jgi:MerR family transcriptional regulator, light-induced transcriptional regulator
MEDSQTVNRNIPVYNIKAISHLVGLLPVTLRAWERRYGLLHPSRGGQGYRLYSEYDLRTLRWIKNQIETGMSISRAVDHLKDLRQKGMDPADEQKSALADNSIAIQNISSQLFTAITAFNENAAHEILRRAFSVYSVDQVLTKVITQTLIEIGEAWHQGKLSIAIEHYATQFFLQHLMSMLTTTMPPMHNATIIAGGAPGEQHQIGLLMLVVMLRWRGWDIKYLGPNLSLEGLPEALAPLQPRMFLFSATREENAKEILKISNVYDKFSDPKPILVFGGQGFQALEIPASLPGIIIQASPDGTVTQIEELLTGFSTQLSKTANY